MRHDGRDPGQTHVLAQQRAEKAAQQAVREHVRRPECAAQPQRNLIARFADPQKPVRRRLCGLILHPTRVERAVSRNIISIQGIDGRRREQPAEEDAAVLMESGVRLARGLGTQLPVRDLACRHADGPIHP